MTAQVMIKRMPGALYPVPLFAVYGRLSAGHHWNVYHLSMSKPDAATAARQLLIDLEGQAESYWQSILPLPEDRAAISAALHNMPNMTDDGRVIARDATGQPA